MTATVAKKITAVLMEASGQANNNMFVILLGVDSKNKIASKDMFGYLMESEDGKLNKYPFTASLGTKDKELNIDCGDSFGDPSETPSKPQGDRYYKLIVVQALEVGGILTLTGGEDRFNYKIQSVENAF